MRLVDLRGGVTLEIKRLLRRSGPLEFWSDPERLPFPLTAAALDALAADLATTTAFGASAHLSPTHLLADLAETGSLVPVAGVRNSRARFERGNCRAEITHVGLHGGHRLTLGLEDPDADSAHEALHTLDLAGFANRSDGATLTGRPLISQRRHAR